MSLIVGLGSFHGDDQLGWAAIDLIRPRLPDGTFAHKIRSAIELIECFERHDAVVVIDAAAPAGRPGQIRSFLWPSPELVQSHLLSSHSLGLVESIQLAEALSQRPADLKIYTIEARDTSPCAQSATTSRGNSMPWSSASSAISPRSMTDRASSVVVAQARQSLRCARASPMAMSGGTRVTRTPVCRRTPVRATIDPNPESGGRTLAVRPG